MLRPGTVFTEMERLENSLVDDRWISTNQRSFYSWSALKLAVGTAVIG